MEVSVLTKWKPGSQDAMPLAWCLRMAYFAVSVQRGKK